MSLLVATRRPVWVVAVFAFVLLAVTFGVRDLPMVDLPQHAAQLAIWSKLDSPLYRQLFELNLRTPYILSYVLAHALSSIIGVVAALKLVVCAAAIGQVLALMLLCSELGYDRWLALLGLPLALGFCFLFGFVSYIVALPFLYLSLAFAVRHTEEPTCSSAIVLFLTLLLLLSAHGLAFAQSLCCISPLLAFGKGSAKLRMAPVILAVLIATVWLLPGPVSTRMGNDTWGLEVHRLLDLPAVLVGTGRADRFATIYGVVLLAFLAAHLGALSRSRARLFPVVLSILGYVAFPESYRGYTLISPRFAILLFPGLLLAFQPRQAANKPRLRFSCFACATIVAIGMTVFATRTVAFNREASTFHAVAEHLPPALRMRPLVFEPEGRAFPDLPVLNHLPAYYLVEKGGLQGYSFAIYPTAVIRYKSGFAGRMTNGEEWRPLEFRVDRELADYDCFLLHSSRAHARELFEPYSKALTLFSASMDWFAYCSRSISADPSAAAYVRE